MILVDANLLLYARDETSPQHDAAAAWIPLPTDRHPQITGEIMRACDARGTLVPDADLAALAAEHGLEVRSADSDFAQFYQITWRNPLDA